MARYPPLGKAACPCANNHISLLIKMSQKHSEELQGERGHKRLSVSRGVGAGAMLCAVLGKGCPTRGHREGCLEEVAFVGTSRDAPGTEGVGRACTRSGAPAALHPAACLWSFPCCLLSIRWGHQPTGSACLPLLLNPSPPRPGQPKPGWRRNTPERVRGRWKEANHTRQLLCAEPRALSTPLCTWAAPPLTQGNGGSEESTAGAGPRAQRAGGWASLEIQLALRAVSTAAWPPPAASTGGLKEIPLTHPNPTSVTSPKAPTPGISDDRGVGTRWLLITTCKGTGGMCDIVSVLAFFMGHS